MKGERARDSRRDLTAAVPFLKEEVDRGVIQGT